MPYLGARTDNEYLTNVRGYKPALNTCFITSRPTTGAFKLPELLVVVSILSLMPSQR